MKSEKNIPGLVFTGEYTSHERVNNGQPVPLYEFAEPKAGKLDINTAEGWNAFVAQQNRERNQRLIAELGYDAAMKQIAIYDAIEAENDRERRERWHKMKESGYCVLID